MLWPGQPARLGARRRAGGFQALRRVVRTLSQQALRVAVLVISLVPILIVYPFLQRHFAKAL
ncbi:hypothetical protein [Nonomuraea sp. NPDC052265]|uniref:hypothetical protein n=1 Tax=Nonomuraea sp. NPDC052265 TaxID=3364374 RepID=UPI0037CAF611